MLSRKSWYQMKNASILYILLLVKTLLSITTEYITSHLSDSFVLFHLFKPFKPSVSFDIWSLLQHQCLFSWSTCWTDLWYQWFSICRKMLAVKHSPAWKRIHSSLYKVNPQSSHFIWLESLMYSSFCNICWCISKMTGFPAVAVCPLSVASHTRAHSHAFNVRRKEHFKKERSNFKYSLLLRLFSSRLISASLFSACLFVCVCSCVWV